MQKEETNENQSFNTNNQKYRKKQAQTIKQTLSL